MYTLMYYLLIRHRQNQVSPSFSVYMYTAYKYVLDWKGEDGLF